MPELAPPPSDRRLAWSDGPVARGSLPMDPLASLRLSVLARCEAAGGASRGMDASLAAALVERVIARHRMIARDRRGRGLRAAACAVRNLPDSRRCWSWRRRRRWRYGRLLLLLRCCCCCCCCVNDCCWCCCCDCWCCYCYWRREDISWFKKSGLRSKPHEDAAAHNAA